MVGGDGTEWIDAKLPTPNYFYRLGSLMGETIDSYCIGYLLDGFFGTRKNQEYLNDIIARFCLTLSIKERFDYLPKVAKQHHDKVYKLKEFQNLKSIPCKFAPKLRGQMPQDHTFWELKLWLEYQIQNNGGEGNMVGFELFLDHALMFYTFKDNSTAKAKCRNIWNWYESRGWTYHMLKKSSKKRKKEIKMTRQERAKSNSKAKAEKARKTVFNVLTGLYRDEYKKVNGKWHINKIAESIRLDKRTVSKYVREWEVKLS